MLVFRRVAAVARLVEMLAACIRARFGDAPEQAHRYMSEADIAEAIRAVRKQVRTDESILEGVRGVFAAVGLDAHVSYDDGLKVRTQVPHSRSGLHGVAPLAAHRDTWGSNVMAQTNWWAPIFPITPERTMALFPTWFDRPVANDSADWDFAEVTRRLRRDGRLAGYPRLPTATEPLAREDAVPVDIEPGDLMAFSGAHLHASVPNTTDRTRFSFEIRTVNIIDARAGRGAPNVDGKAPHTAWGLFRRMTDRRRLGASEIAKI